MKNYLLKLSVAGLCSFLFSHHLYAQCNPATVVISTANTIVNTYYPATASITARAVTINLGAAQGAAVAITKGDLLQIIQMQGSAITSTNSAAYGSGSTSSAGYTTSVAGTYEFVIAGNNVSTTGGSLTISGGTANAYTSAAATAADGQYLYQVIRVPQYKDLSFSSAAASISGLAWNGTVGGVVALEVTGTLTMNGATINANSLGFRGGGGRKLGGTTGFLNTDVRTTSTSNGSKGEGIAGTPKYVRTSGTTTIITGSSEGYPNGGNGNGAPGNAGGGGTDGNPGGANDQNTGGGGGGNGGAGGRGGNSWSSNLSVGGYGGVAPSFLATTRLVLGGGGGAGTTNDGTGVNSATAPGVNSSGGAGGGLVMIKAATISGTGNITASGESGDSTLNDGAGGGGAGGTVYISAANTAGLAALTIIATGGNGGNAWPSNTGTANAHGAGGGGGGGVIYANGAIHAASTAANGINGTTLTPGIAYGATSGTAGIKITTAATLTTATNTACRVIVLPVQFLEVEVVRAGNGTKVVWKVAHEQNISNYEIQKSTDAIRFTKVGEVPQSANTGGVKAYQYTDVAATEDVYYRIRQVATNSTFTYSKVVHFKGSDVTAVLSIAPNPVRANAIIHCSSSKNERVVLDIYNVFGQQILHKAVQLTQGNNIINLSLPQDMASGTYVILVGNASQSSVLFTKQ